MTNSTALKYTNLYTVNRNKNDIFDNWLKANYQIFTGKNAWDYGQETFVDLATNERIYSEAKIMQKYVKGKNPYFKDFSHFDEYLDTDLSIEQFFAK